MVSSLSAFGNACPYVQNVRRNQSSGFDASKPIKVYMLDEQCIYSSTAADGQSVHVMYEEDSTPEDPVVRIFGNSQSGEYEEIVHINEIDPSNATYPELCALLAHKNRTGVYTSGGEKAVGPGAVRYGPRQLFCQGQLCSENQRVRFQQSAEWRLLGIDYR